MEILKKSMCLLAILGASVGAHAGLGQWTPAGGLSGGWTDDVEYVGSGTAVVVTRYAVYRTTNHGATWTRIRELHPGELASKIAVNPASTDQVLVTGAMMLRSVNGGQEFTTVQTSFNGVLGDVAFSHDGTYAFTVTSAGDLWRSTDGGTSWTRFAAVLPMAVYTDIDTDPFDRDTLYAGSGAQHYVSRNGGTTWDPIVPGQYFDLRASRSTAGRVLSVGTQAFTPTISTNYGATWTALSAPGDLRTLGTAPGQRAIVGNYLTQHVFTSPDDGETWIDRGRLPNATALEFSFDPLEPEHVLAATFAGVVGSNDGGVTWQERLGGLGDPYGFDIAVSRAGSGALYVAASDLASVHRLDLSAGTFTGVGHLSTPLLGYPGAPFYLSGFRIVASPANVNTLYLLRDDQLGMSSDGGTTWGKLADFDGAVALAIDPSNAQIMYSAGSFMHRSTNGGASWTQLPASLPGTALDLVVDPSNGATVYALVANSAGGSSPVYRSTDSAQHFTAIPWGGGQPLSPYAMAIDPSQPGTIYLATDQGLYKATSAAGPWTRLVPYANFPVTHIGDVIVDPQNPSVIYAAHLGDEPMRSVDGGESWTPLAPLSALTVYPFKKLALVPGQNNRLLGLRRDGGVYQFDLAPALSLASAGTSLTASSAGTLQMQVANAGTIALSRVRVTGTLPAASGNYTVQAAGATCAVSGRDLSCDAGILRPAASVTLSIAFTPTTAGESTLGVTAYELSSPANWVFTVAPGSASSSSSGGGGGGGGGRLDYLLLASLLALLLYVRRRFDGVFRRVRQN